MKVSEHKNHSIGRQRKNQGCEIQTSAMRSALYQQRVYAIMTGGRGAI